MNDRDRDNLHFLLRADQKSLEEWFFTASEDDREYASELFKKYSEELSIAKALHDERMIDNLTDANVLLNKFRLGSK